MRNADSIVVETLKPRAKWLNDVLRTRKGGKMKDPRKQSRAAAKSELRKELAS